jgi:hypothetical protein
MPRCTPRSANSSRWRAQGDERCTSPRRAAVCASVLALLATTFPAAAQEQDWRDAVEGLLTARAQAVERGDRDAFARTMQDAPRAFVRDRLAWLDRLHRLPLTGYELALDPDAPLDLAPALRSAPAADEVRVVTVTERLVLSRSDPEPSAGTLYLTVARSGGRWSVVADDGLDDLGLFSERQMWDFAPVEALQRGDVLALHHGRPAVASDLARGLQAAIERVEDSWPYPWPTRVVLALPRDAAQLGRIFHTTVDLGPFVAFAASSAERVADGIRTGGIRVYIQPETYFDQPAGYRSEVLSHEMLHVAAMPLRGAFTTSWIEEGVAQIYGEPAPGATPHLDARVTSGAFTGRLPEEHEFFLGTSADIEVSYDASLSFMSFLRGRFGSEAPARFYKAVGAITPVSFGTARYHLDRAARRAFDRGFADLERAWLQSIGARG